MREANHMIDASDHWTSEDDQFSSLAIEKSPGLTTNRRGVMPGGRGRTCERVALAKKSMMAGVVFALLNDACRSCTFGNSSEMTNITGSRGNLNHIGKGNEENNRLRCINIPLLPRRDPFLCGYKSISPNSSQSNPFQASCHLHRY